MNKSNLIKRIVGFLVLLTIFATMMPNFVFASYSSENLAHVSNWEVVKTPTHSTFISSGDGVRIDQTKQTLYKEGTTKNNGNADGKYDLYFTKTNDKGFSVSTDVYSGNVTITMKYSISLDKTNSGSAFYQLNIPGYAHIRITQENTSVRNSDSGSGYVQKSLSNKNGEVNTLVITINTVSDTFTAKLNDTDAGITFPSMNAFKGEDPAKYVSNINIVSMERMDEDAYLDISSVVIEDDSTENIITLDAETQAIIDSLPDTLVEDQNNVTQNISIPWENADIKWKSTNSSVIDNYGKIQRMSASDPQRVQIKGTIDGKTADGESITVTVTYNLVVTGLNGSLKNTKTVGEYYSDEKWYTPPERNGVEDGYPILGDPNYISDETFFGKWDSTKGDWALEPFFDYSSNSGLSAVENYAKAGDYENAKVAIQKYYADNFANKATKQESMAEKDIAYTNVLYEMVSRNAYPTNVASGFPINYFYVSKDKSTVKIDVTNRLKEAAGFSTCFSTMVVSVDKYKSDSVIYSSESDTPPVLVVTLTDGTTITCRAEKDSYIQGGTYSDEKYGSATKLLVQEAGVHNNFEDRTKRAYIGFDISGLESGANITDAYIELTGENTGSDNERMLLLYWYMDSSWQEDTVCFNTFADYLYFSCNDMVCWDYVTSNNPTEKGKVCGYHRGYELGDISDIYSYYDYIGSDHADFEEDYEKYAYTCIRQYMGLINSLGIDHSVMNNLDLACHMSAVSEDFLRLINSEYMTPEIFTAFLKHLWLLAEDHIYECFGDRSNNWAAHSTGGVYSICARYPEFKRSEIWLEATREENNRVTNGFVFEDGMSLELSQGYTETILGTFNNPYDLMALTGSESPYNEGNEQLIYNLLMSLYKQSAPGRGGFGFGDSTSPYATQKSTFERWYNSLFEGDPIIAYMATSGKSGWLPEHATTNFPVSLRTFMRSDWSDKALAMGITNKISGSHGHKDALSISMYAYGKFLLVDPGYGAATTGHTPNYMKSPQQHNTVTVNDYTNYLNDDYTINPLVSEVNTLENKDGKEECFDSNSQYDFIEYSTEAYTATELSQRSVTFLKNQKMWIVTDYIVPNDTDAENVYTQNWHLHPDLKMEIVNDDTKVIRGTIENSPNVMIVPVAPDEINEAYSAKTLFSEKSGVFEKNNKAVLKKTKSGVTTYSTIILPMDTGENFDVSTTKLSTSLENTAGDKINAFKFTVTNENTGENRNFVYYHLNDASLKGEVTIGDYTTDAQTLVVEEYDDGTIKSMYMVNGTYVSKEGNEIFRTTEETSASFIRDKDTKVLDYSVSDKDANALKEVTFHSSLADTITYNGVAYEFTEADGKITFTDINIVLPEDPVEDVNKGTLIFDSALNPELLESTLTTNEYYKVTEMGENGKEGIKFENVTPVPYKSDGSPNSKTNVVGMFRFNGIFEDTENQTKTITNLMAGKYAVELTLEHSIDTERMRDGSKYNTFSPIYFGRANESLTVVDGPTSGLVDNFIDFRLLNNSLYIIRSAETQKNYIENNISNVALQTLEASKEWKLRVVFDTVNQTYSVFVNDQYDKNASNFPYNVDATAAGVWTPKVGNYVPDLSIIMMDANTEGSYVWVKNVKLYEIDSDETDARILKVNEMIPTKLYAGNLNCVDSNLTIPSNSDVTWTSSDTAIMNNAGILQKKVTTLTPITFTAVGTFKDTDATDRVFDFKKVYNMSVLTDNSWTMTATKSDNVVSASVSCETKNYGSKPVLIIAGYNSDGAVCDMDVKYVTEELENYTYTLSNDSITAKVFLLDNFNSAMPLAASVVFR